MGKVLDTFEFPHGGRKGLDFDFEPLTDGRIHQLEKGVDFDMETNAETFLGALSRFANQRNLRVNKHISDDKNVVTVRVRPKKPKKVTENSTTTENKPKRGAKATA